MKHAHGSISITTEATIKVLGRARIPGGDGFAVKSARATNATKMADG
jgi:hypothetical protein